MELILIRHLKTPGNEKRQYIGSTDEELSEQEVLNFKQRYKIDSYPQVEQVIVSPMKEFRACCDEFIIMTDDGSYGEKGVVTAPLEQRIVDGADFDEVITIGPLIMMKFVVKTTKPHNVKTVVSMNPIMVDGTGMCGGCRLTVGAQTKFACVDGPDFDGFEVDFDEAMHRGTMYKPFEAHAREAECNLLKQEVQ